MTIASLIIRTSSARSARRFEEATRDPMRAQAEKLMQIVRRNAQADYGRRHHFASIQSIRDYQNAAPVVDYAKIQSDVERMIEGEKNVLTAEDPIMFAQTSGTTGKPKYIPVTPTCQGHDHKDVMRTWLWHAQRAHPGLFSGKITSLVSPAVEGLTPSGIPFGSTSGHMYRNIPWAVRRAYSVPYRAFEIEDYQAKYYAIMRTAVEQGVSFLCTANPSSILMLCNKGNEFAEEIIRDIRDGKLSGKYPIDSSIRAELEKVYRPNPECARRLEAMRARRSGVLKPGDYWPSLALIGCWKGGTVGHYLEKFEEWFSPDGARPVPVRDWGYLASEMRGSIPLSDEGNWGVLAVSTNFYEFVPVDEVSARPDEPQAWNFLTVAELEADREYYIFVTTTGGLYRYDINDIVRVVSYYNRTPQIVFLRKGRGMTNLTGEKLSVNQVIDAFQAASSATGLNYLHFKAEADQDNNRYVLRVEFTEVPPASGQLDYLRAFEQHLQEINIEYRAKRRSLRLAAPVLHVMRLGWYERQRREMALSGRRMFQAKSEILSPIKLSTSKIQIDLANVVQLDEPEGGSRASDES